MTVSASVAVPVANTSGGAVVMGNLTVGGSFVGRDQYIGYTYEQVVALIDQIKRADEHADQPTVWDGRCPYVGLAAFQEADAALFFGRERVVKDLVERVHQSRFVCIAGPSGSGKSSLARAGLIHALRGGAISGSEKWLYEAFTPRGNPIEQLANAMSAMALRADMSAKAGDAIRERGLTDPEALSNLADVLARGGPDQRVVLLVDQFEEIFTQTRSEEERQAFLNLITFAVGKEDGPGGGRMTAIIAMRSDFISQCATYQQLRALINRQFRLIGAMEPDELAQAVVLPALEVGASVEPKLVAQMINDTQGEPGALPLIQFTLRDLFESKPRKKGGVVELTLAEYFERGGIQDALERHAEATFEKLDKEQQELARNMFTHLIEIGRGTEDTRRTANFAELVPASGDPGKIEAVVQALSAARLITTDAPTDETRTVTLSHETLIDAWPRLKRLVNESRAAIALQNDIGEHAAQWDGHGRDASYLYSGARLQTAQEQLEANKITLNALAQAFIDASIHEEEERIRLKEAARQNELEQARKLAAQQQQIAEEQRKRAEVQLRASKRQRMLLAVLAGLLAIATGVAIFAVNQYRTAEEQRRVAEEQARIAKARQLAAQSVTRANVEADTSLLLALEAYQDQVRSLPEIQSSVLSALQCCSDQLISFLRGHTDRVWSVAFSPDQKLLASGSDDGTIVLWDVAARTVITTLVGPNAGASIYSVAFSPDGKWLAAGNGDGKIALWDVERRELSRELTGHSGNVLSVAFSPDGERLASGGADKTVILWDIAVGGPIKTFTGHTHWVWSVAFSPDGKTLASGGRDSTLRLWNLDPMTSAITPTLVLTDHQAIVVRVAFHPKQDTAVLASSDASGKVILWDTTAWPQIGNKLARTPAITIHSAIAWGLQFHRDGDSEILATAGDNGRVRFWRVMFAPAFAKSTLEPLSLALNGHTRGIFGIAFSPDGKLLAAASQDSLISLWKVSSGSAFIGQSDNVQDLALSSDGKTLVSVGRDGNIITWDVNTRQLVSQVHIAQTGKVTVTALSPDGRFMALSGENFSVVLWNASAGPQMGEPFTGHTKTVTSLVFSPNTKVLASGSSNGVILLWDVANHRQIGKLEGHTGAVDSLAFSRDGTLLASGGCFKLITSTSEVSCGRGEIRLWKLDTQLQLGQPLVGKSGSVSSLAFSEDNAMLASGSVDGPVVVWDIATRERLYVFNLYTAQVGSVAFTPDGKWLASGDGTGRINVWNLMTGQPYGKTFNEHQEYVTTLAFDRSGKSLFSGSNDNTLVVRDLSSEHWRERACRLANRNLTEDEWKQFVGDEPRRKTCPQFS